MKKKNIENWKKSIRMMNSYRSLVERFSLFEEGKKVGINEVAKGNEIINNGLK